MQPPPHPSGDREQDWDDLPDVSHHIRPVLLELVRMRDCSEPITLIVDAILVIPFIGDSDEGEAYVLWVSDGQKSIQALLDTRLHFLITRENIRNGSILLLMQYQITTSRRLNKPGNVWHLIVEDAYVVGFEACKLRPIVFDEPRMLQNKPSTPNSQGEEVEVVTPSTSHSRFSSVTKTPVKEAHSPATPSSGSTIAGNSDASPSLRLSSRKRPHDTDLLALGSVRTNGQGEVEEDSKRAQLPQKPSDQEQVKAGTITTHEVQLLPITRPLEVTPLRDLTGDKKTRNRVVDVFAVICAVDPNVIRRKNMPDQRELRIMDASTPKRVQLTVFVGARDFRPAAGTVALFRSVTTHEWNGGSLKVYPRDCAGRKWFFPEPVGMQACDVGALRLLWEKVQAEDATLI